MKANYHSHTPRCNHAVGAERDYVLRAIEGGFSVLGFSDHTPYPFDGVDYHSGVRMGLDELPNYAETVRSLKAQYADTIEIHLGVEAEFYPRFFDRLVSELRGCGVEYMILGQHFLNNEFDGIYSGKASCDSSFLDRYCAQSIEAMQTGLYTYFAHPDLVNFQGSEEEYDRQIRRLCRSARDCGIPMEINLLGLRDNRHYPNRIFWQIAGEEGVTVVLGSDAHTPKDVWDPESEARAMELVRENSLNLVPTVSLVRL